jgi:hypothetical protein
LDAAEELAESRGMSFAGLVRELLELEIQAEKESRSAKGKLIMKAADALDKVLGRELKKADRKK